MPTGLEFGFGVALAIVGLSHATRAGLWARAFHALGRTGVAPLVIGTFTLPMGLALVIGHNVWVLDWPVIVTLFGWAMTVKASLYLLFPATFERHLPHPDRLERDTRRFRAVGWAMTALGLLLAWGTQPAQ